MRYVKQRIEHDPDNGRWGDCHRAAVASVLQLPYEAVPHFMDHGVSAAEAGRIEREWLHSIGLTMICLPFNADLSHLLSGLGACAPDVHYILGGTSRNGTGHSVVCRGGEIVHDPSPVESGIVGPMDDGFFWTTFFVPRGDPLRGARFPDAATDAAGPAPHQAAERRGEQGS
ncbi:MAG TPA: hypothetical protein VEC14_02375 [Reyranellaceae bacterium]|nr:hypothetical protein [Reyranellaceae bacterium]